MPDTISDPPAASQPGGIGARLSAGALHASLTVSPRPMAWMIRRQLATRGQQLAATLNAHAPINVAVTRNQRYDSHNDTLLDIYRPADIGAAQRLPTVVWTHGGAFLGGTKDDLGGYLQHIAAAGFTVVAIRYSLAPHARHPTPVRQLMSALRYLNTHAERLHVDPTRLLLAGDSAGAHITAQAAAIVTTPGFAQQLGVRPTITTDQLRGIILCSGMYDLTRVDPDPARHDWTRTVGWTYAGTRNFRHNHHFTTTTTITDHITADYPPTFITAGNTDPLLPQSYALVAALEYHRVHVDDLFHPPTNPPLPHQYQFHLTLNPAHTALQHLTRFAHKHTTHPPHHH